MLAALVHESARIGSVPQVKMLIEYPEWQPDYFAAVMKVNAVGLLVKVLQAETAIFNRCQAWQVGMGQTERKTESLAEGH